MPKKLVEKTPIDRIHHYIERHTRGCLFEWVNNGHGSNMDKVFESKAKVMEVVAKELKDAYSAGLSARNGDLKP